MLQGLVIAQAVPQGLLKVCQRQEEPIMGRAAAQHFPQAFDDLQLRTVTGQPIPLQMGPRLEHAGDDGSLMPGGVVNDEHDSGVLRGRIDAGDIAQVARKRLLHAPSPRGADVLRPRGPALVHDTRGQLAGHQVQRAEDVDQIVTIQGAYHGPVPFEPQRRPHSRDHRKPRFILTQHDKLPRVSFF